MPSLTQARSLNRIIRENLIASAASGAPMALFGNPPRYIPSGEIKEYNSPPLDAGRSARDYPRMTRWAELHLNSVDALTLGCVFEGEVDYQVHRPHGSGAGKWILNLKANSLFLIAPGIPFTDGSKIPWERPDADKAYARVLLVRLRMEGAMCHSYTMDKGKLWVQPYVMVYNDEVFSCGEKLLEEMRQLRPPLALVYLYWQIIGQHLLRSFQENDVAPLYVPYDTPAEVRHELMPPSGKSLAERMVNLMQNHLDDEDFKIEDAALHLGMSQRQLNRIFKKYFQVSMAQYLTQMRLQKACTLLKDTTLPVHRVQRYCGYKNSSHFSAWFLRHQKITPAQFRKKHAPN